MRAFLFSLLILPLLSIVIGVSSFTLWYPSIIEDFEHSLSQLQTNTVIYDRHGKPYTIIDGVEDRQVIDRKHVHRYMQLSVIAMEDARFFQHRGLDIFRIFGALFANIRESGYVQGASTITQQLVKLMLLSPEKTLSRKLKEAVMALALEFRYSKLQILEHYLNTIYLGHGNYGAQQAAMSYFDKSASDLTLSQSAFLAGILNRPETYLRLPRNFKRSEHLYFPQQYLKKALDRQKRVLQRLHQHQWIKKAEYLKALQEPLQVRIPSPISIKAPYFVQHIRMLLKQKHHLPQISSRGYKIYTTLDKGLQAKAEQEVQKAYRSPHRQFNQAAMVALEPHTGQVRALVGGTNFSNSQFNRVTQAKRQPGSAFKTILYATALEDGFTVNSPFMDEPLSFEWEEQDGNYSVYEPRNFDRLFGAEREQVGSEGEVYYEDSVTLLKAFAQSLNTVAVQLLSELGIAKLATTANALNLPLRDDMGLCLALGCSEVRLLNLTAAYTPFMNRGRLAPPVFILRIEDSQGREIYQHQPISAPPVFSEWTIHQMDQMLQETIQHGTGKQANWRGNRHSIGGKTGTTTDFRDAWFIGYAPELVTGVWVGNDDNTSMRNETGGHTPAQIWSRFMKFALEHLPDRQPFPAPAYRSFPTCRVSGGLATYACPDVSMVHYIADHPPYETCPFHPGVLLPEADTELPSEFSKKLNDSFSEDIEPIDLPDIPELDGSLED